MTGVLLINLGTPDSPSVKDVRSYLTQFLNDPSVIDIHPLARFLLVNFIIVPFRAPKSAEIYQKTWTKEGSPLLIHTKNLTKKLQKSLGENFIVEFGMRYKNPDIQSAFRKLKEKKADKIIVVPLYPQYASSSTGSTIAELQKVMKKENFTNVKIIEHFHQNEDFLNAWVEIAKKYVSPLLGRGAGGAAFLFSYHGLPERQIFKECKKRGGSCNSINDCITRNQKPETRNPFCYRAACYETTAQLAKRLNLPADSYETSFQSRLDDKWLKPYSDKIVAEKAKNGIKKLVVFSPAFVADCLETIYEIGVEYDEIFRENGGVELTFVKSLNDSDAWVNALKKMVISAS